MSQNYDAYTSEHWLRAADWYYLVRSADITALEARIAALEVKNG